MHLTGVGSSCMHLTVLLLLLLHHAAHILYGCFLENHLLLVSEAAEPKTVKLVKDNYLAGGGSTTARGILRLCPASACQTGLPWSSPPA